MTCRIQPAAGAVVEEGHRVRRVVADHGQRAFVLSIHRDLGSGRRASIRTHHPATDSDLRSGKELAGFTTSGIIELHRQAVAHILHREFAIAEPELGLLVLPQALLRPLDHQHRHEAVRRIAVIERNLDHRLGGLQVGQERARNILPLDRDEGLALNGESTSTRAVSPGL